ncbi:MAG: hypothetical protein KDC38_02745 [Planctomycetes bacterium]|nr:hypothetical protein [Planctomycetota bacterium]
MKRVLIAVLDASLRSRLFARVGEFGHRVDAVADALAIERRLAKDEYDVVLVERGLASQPAETDAEWIEVDPGLDPVELDRRLDTLRGASDPD